MDALFLLKTLNVLSVNPFGSDCTHAVVFSALFWPHWWRVKSLFSSDSCVREVVTGRHRLNTENQEHIKPMKAARLEQNQCHRGVYLEAQRGSSVGGIIKWYVECVHCALAISEERSVCCRDKGKRSKQLDGSHMLRFRYRFWGC